MKTFKISSEDSVREMKKNFNDLFPLLNIRFFNKKHEAGSGNPLSEELKDEDTKLEDLTNSPSSFVISVDGHKKVSTLENDFEVIGIHVQIFRKSGDVWIQTTTTDDWTLAQQNKEAEQAA